MPEATLKIVRDALSLCGVAIPDKNALDDHATFAAVILHALRLARPDEDIKFDEDGRIRIDTREDVIRSIRFKPGAIFDGFSAEADPERNLSVLASLVGRASAVISIMMEEVDDARKSRSDLGEVIPLLKPSEYIGHSERRASKAHIETGIPYEDALPVHWTSPSGLVAVAAIDRPEVYHFPTTGEFFAHGIAPDQVIDSAMANLRKAYGAIGQESDYEKGFHEFTGVGGAAASLVLLDEFLENEAEKAGCDLVIHAMDADSLLLIPLSNRHLVVRLISELRNGQAPANVGTRPLFYTEGSIREYSGEDHMKVLADCMSDVRDMMTPGPRH